jgi:2-polyprenyl-6-methoxyphenol hydroxylase-like FAD-dependent oxidoreductase
MHILISGSGIAGPTLAYWLSQSSHHHHHKITILEKAPTLLPHGQNVDIQGAAVTVIRKMHLMPQILLANTREAGTRFVSTHGVPFAQFPVKEGQSASLTSEFEILRGDLAKILYDATKDLPNVEYMFGTTVKEVLQNDERGVKVLLSSGEVRSYDLLVAADGQWSKLRSLVFPSTSIDIKHQGMYAVYYTVPRLPSDKDFWDIHVTSSSGTISTRPDPHGTMRAMFTFMPCTAAQETAWKNASRAGRKAQSEVLATTFAGAGWKAPRLLSAMDTAPDFYFHSVSQVRMKSWTQNRVVCLGDAAYCPTPLTGLGTSLAIIGAFMLAGELSSHTNDKTADVNGSSTDICPYTSLTAALSSYEDAFRPFVSQSQDLPPFVPAVMHPGSVWKRWILQAFLKLVARVLAMPWVASRTGDAESRNDGFALPDYSPFETVSEK